MFEIRLTRLIMQNRTLSLIILTTLFTSFSGASATIDDDSASAKVSKHLDTSNWESLSVQNEIPSVQVDQLIMEKSATGRTFSSEIKQQNLSQQEADKEISATLKYLKKATLTGDKSENAFSFFKQQESSFDKSGDVIDGKETLSSGFKDKKTGDKKQTEFQIYGADNRTEVKKIGYWSETRIGQIIVQQNDKQFSQCSGTLISDRHVLTSAHCVTQKDDYGNMRLLNVPIYFAPGRTRDKDIVGYFYGKRIFVPKPYITFAETHTRHTTTAQEIAVDLAVIELENRISNKIGYYDYATAKDNVSLESIGYPGDKPLYTRWQQSCNSGNSFADSMGYFYTNKCDSIGGQSGSSMLYKKQNGGKVIMGVLSASSDDSAKQTALKSGNILLWNTLRSDGSFNYWRQAGTKDFLATWVHWDNMASFLSDKVEQSSISELTGKLKNLSYVGKLPTSGRKNIITLQNGCYKDVWMAYASYGNGRLDDHGFYASEKNGNQVTFTTEDSETYFYWARSKDGDSEWTGDVTRYLHDHGLEMRKRKVKPSEYSFASKYGRTLTRFTCNKS